MEEGPCASTDLTRRIHTFCKEQKEKRRQEWESHRKALAVMKQSKHKQPERKESCLLPDSSKYGKNKKCGTKIHKSRIYYIS